MTRRPIKHQPDVPVNDAIPRRNYPHGPATADWYWRPKHGHLNGAPSKGWDFKCPFGQPGDRLWVRETFADIGCRLTYRADLDDGAHCAVKRWIPSLHMRRIDCRILLEITEVRVERLQTITTGQAMAEGIIFTDFGLQDRPGKVSLDGGKTFRALKPKQAPGWHAGDATHPDRCMDTAYGAFANLWARTGGDWAANPWVWVIEFKVIEPAPAGCNYHGSHFGAPYPDAQCVEGFLWDEDSCDDPGGPVLHGGEIPCPKCNAEAYADHQRQEPQE